MAMYGGRRRGKGTDILHCFSNLGYVLFYKILGASKGSVVELG